MTLAYLATPYTRYTKGHHIAFVDACRLAGRLLKAGVNVYSPIAHSHAIAIRSEMDPLDLSVWLPFDELMMARCDALIVAHMEGWQESLGIAHEVKFFVNAQKPIFDCNPKTLAMVRR